MRIVGAYVCVAVAGISFGVGLLATGALVNKRRISPAEIGLMLGGLLYSLFFLVSAYALCPLPGSGAVALFAISALAAGRVSFAARRPVDLTDGPGLWVRRNPKEVKHIRHAARVARIRRALLGACIVTAFVAFSRFGAEQGDRIAWIFVPLREIPGRLPASVVMGAIFALVYFKTGNRKPVVLCPECGRTKYRDGESACSCGGRFEDIEHMKWIEK